ncbi:class-III pyridoxal-phosphate-dependent aminotransferase [Sorangium sp. So ce176]|uniref:class-III pyridoxal-phosphate-dependent aminotransferase n=1 Tax=Sorangium sp. So ce176 TaxID=3133286 RepID=UPI003F625BAD
MDSHEDILRDGFDDYRAFVNPLIAQRARLAREPIRVVRAEGGLLVDSEGLAIEDFHGTQAFGHRNPAVASALRAFLDSDAPSWYPSRVNPFAGRLARRLCERAGHYDNVFFGCTGSDAVEASLKLARALTRKPVLVGLTGAYHGCSYGSVSFMGAGYLRDPFVPLLQGATSIPFGDVDALARVLAGGDVAAVLVEPIQGEGGVRELPPPFVEALCDLTAKHGALLIADEVQTGLGRTGRGFLATERWPRRPDVVLLAKQLGGGLLPLSAMLTRREIFVRAYGKEFAAGESHNNTMGYNALSAVAGLATLDLVTDELVATIRDTGAYLRERLDSALRPNRLFKEVRGAGLMLGVQLETPDHPWLSFEHFGFPDLAHMSVVSPLVCHRLYRRGFFCFTCGHDWTIFRLQPRFDIPRATLDAFVDAAAEALAYVEGLT